MSALALEQLDPTFPARQRMSKLLNLPYVGSAKQLEFHLAPESGMNQPVLYGGAMGGGKDLDNFTNCSTPFGMKPIGVMKVGDRVHVADGTIARVIGVWPQGVSRRMRVTFSDGATVIAGPDHLWFGSEAMKKYKADRHWVDIDGPGSAIKGRIYTTEQVKAVCEKAADRKQRRGGGKGGSFLIPVSQPVQFTRASRWGTVKIDPYVLGVLLGDGSLSGKDVSFCSGDPDIPLEVSRRLGYMPIESQCKGKKKPLWNYTFSRRDPIARHLDDYGLLGHRAWEKFIPTVYKYGSIEERWWLLRGLMDTDGTVDRPGKISFTTVSKQLAEDVRFIAESLGGVVTQSERIGKSYVDGTAKECRLAYTLRIKFRNCADAFFLPRKRSIAGAPQGLYRRVVSVEEIEEAETTCITIDHPSGLFLATERFIVTHNSMAISAEAIRECLEIPRNRVLMARLEAVNFKATTLVNLLQLMPNNVQHKPSTSMFVFPNGSLLMYTGLGTEKERQKLRSAEFGSIFIDEATQIDLQTFIEAGARLRWKPAADANRLKMRLTCNPEPGWIKDDFVSNPKSGYRYIAALPTDNAYLPAQYIQQMKEQLPTEWFQAYMLGDWDAMTPQTVVLPAYLLDEAMRRKPIVDNSLDTIWSVDVARFGDDTTVVAKRQGLNFDLVDSWKKASITTTVNNIVTHYQIASVKPTAINVDDDGVGGGVTDGLRQAQANGLLGACLINPVIVQAQARDTTHYDRLKAELWFTFKALLESKAPVSLPAKPVEIKHDLESHRYDVRGGKAILEPKSIVKKRLGRSPDYGDAIILLMFERPGDYIAYDSPEDQVKRQLAKLPVEQRALYLANLERRRKAQQRIMQFQGRYGVQIYSGDDDGLGY